MVVKILGSSRSFDGVRYNHEKMKSGRGELLKFKNFGALMPLGKLGPQDYINYLRSVSAANPRITKPQFHAVISAKGKNISKYELLAVGEKWMSKMGYGESPYLVVFHSDTDNNHIHLVSTRVGKTGRKIPSAFEKIRAVRHISVICDNELKSSEKLSKLLNYRFSTVAQVRTLLEQSEFEIRLDDGRMQVLRSGKNLKELEVSELEKRAKHYSPDQKRSLQLRAILKKLLDSGSLKDELASSKPDLNSRLEYLSTFIHKRSGTELVFHSRDAKPPYGYTIIDHPGRSVLKGSEVMPLRELLSFVVDHNSQITEAPVFKISYADPGVEVDHILFLEGNKVYTAGSMQPLDLKEDIDDEAINGRNRQRKRKARTNTR